MGDGDPEKKLDPAALLLDLMKEQTIALVRLSDTIGRFHDAMEDQTAAIDDLREDIGELGTNMIGVSVALGRGNFVEDRMLEIQIGKPDATPPLPGREPTPADRLKAVHEWEEKLVKDAKAEEAAEKEQEKALAAAVPEKPKEKPAPLALHAPKPPIITSKPPRPPLPVVEIPVPTQK
jgi:hypothetical protein